MGTDWECELGICFQKGVERALIIRRVLGATAVLGTLTQVAVVPSSQAPQPTPSRHTTLKA